VSEGFFKISLFFYAEQAISNFMNFKGRALLSDAGGTGWCFDPLL
jgi:hypothetical protein